MKTLTKHMASRVYSGAVIPKTTFCIGLSLLLMCFIANVPASGIASILLLLAYILLLFRSNPAFLIKYLPLLFGIAINIGGCFVVEYFDLYLNELKMNSHFIGSLPLLIFSRWIFIVVLELYDQRWGVEKTICAKPKDEGYVQQGFIGILAIIFLLLGMYLFLQVMNVPSFTLGLDRFDYIREGYISSLDQKLAVLASYGVLISVIATRFRQWRLVGAIGIIFRVLYLLWTGAKFGAFFDCACMFLFVYYDKIYLLGKKTLYKIFAIMCAILAGLVLAAVILHGVTSTQNPSSYILQRLAQQGQLWAVSYEKSGGDIHLGEIGDEFSYFDKDSENISENVGAHYGIYKIMYYTSSDQVMIDNKLSSGSRYTEGAYASMYYYFGPIGPVVFSIVLGVALAFLINTLIKSAQNNRFIESVIAWRFYRIVQVTMGMFVFQTFFDLESFICYGYLLLAFLLRPQINKRTAHIKQLDKGRIRNSS